MSAETKIDTTNIKEPSRAESVVLTEAEVMPQNPQIEQIDTATQTKEEAQADAESGFDQLLEKTKAYLTT